MRRFIFYELREGEWGDAGSPAEQSRHQERNRTWHTNVSVQITESELGAEMLVPEQCKAARAALDWGVRELAVKAGVASDTVARFERSSAEGPKLKRSTVDKIQRAIQEAGIHLKFGQYWGIEIRPKLLNVSIEGGVYVFDGVHKGKKFKAISKKEFVEDFVSASDKLCPLRATYKGHDRLLKYVERRLSSLLVGERRKIPRGTFRLSQAELKAERPRWLE